MHRYSVPLNSNISPHWHWCFLLEWYSYILDSNSTALHWTTTLNCVEDPVAHPTDQYCNCHGRRSQPSRTSFFFFFSRATTRQITCCFGKCYLYKRWDWMATCNRQRESRRRLVSFRESHEKRKTLSLLLLLSSCWIKCYNNSCAHTDGYGSSWRVRPNFRSGCALEVRSLENRFNK